MGNYINIRKLGEKIMEIKHTQANNIQKILQWLVETAPFQYRITTHQNGELHIKMEVPEEIKREQ